MGRRADTIKYLGRTPDHDDRVEEGVLSNAFDITAQAWKVSTDSPVANPLDLLLCADASHDLAFHTASAAAPNHPKEYPIKSNASNRKS